MTTPENLPPNLIGLIDVLVGRREVDKELARRLEAVRELIEPVYDESRPFLSVLLRTQGKRIEPFKDALLCLTAQTDQDFEIIVLQHNAEAEDAAAVRAVLDQLPPEFAERVSLAVVEGGTRATPLNEGVRRARGNFLAVFDDDDLLFGDWVEQFHIEAAKGGGRLLRAVVANQEASTEQWTLGLDGFRSTSRAVAEYESTFDQLQHLLVNQSPFMSWAFPRSLFFVYGVRFDEELTVCEDWDVILRGSLLCGVDDVPALTAIYRRWQDAESSYTAHSFESWRESEARVVDRIDQGVYMMPPGAIQASRRMVVFNRGLSDYRFLFSGSQLRFPLNVGWRIARPPLLFARRVRNRLRRLRRDQASG